MKTIDLTTTQLASIKRDFVNRIDDFVDMGVCDYEYTDDTVKVYVEFGYCLREIDIDKIEIFDDDFEPIHSQNALELRNYIGKTVDNYNLRQVNYEERMQEEEDYRNHIMFGLYY